MDYLSQLTRRINWRNSLDEGWQTMTQSFLRLFLITLILVAVDLPLMIFEELAGDGRSASEVYFELMGLAYIFLFIPVFNYGADLLFVQAARRESLQIKNILIGFNNFLNIILANLLKLALIGIGIIALIIPGIIIACRLAFVSFLVMDKGMDPLAATETSWKLTRGHGWTIFGLGVTSFFVFIAGLLFFIVGAIPAAMWIKSTFASLYVAVLKEKGEDPVLNPEPAV